MAGVKGGPTEQLEMKEDAGEYDADKEKEQGWPPSEQQQQQVSSWSSRKSPGQRQQQQGPPALGEQSVSQSAKKR